MPTDTDVAVDDPDKIDSTCHANPLDADGATDVWCGENAVAVVSKPAGHRVYLCQEHAEQLQRFNDAVFDGDGIPTAVVCKRCNQFTPRNRVNFDKICENCQVGD